MTAVTTRYAPRHARLPAPVRDRARHLAHVYRRTTVYVAVMLSTIAVLGAFDLQWSWGWQP